MKTVEIVQDEDGEYRVGLVPEDGQEMAEQGESDYLSPVAGIDEALDVARDLLTSDMDTGEADESMAEGFNSVNTGTLS